MAAIVSVVVLTRLTGPVGASGIPGSARDSSLMWPRDWLSAGLRHTSLLGRLHRPRPWTGRQPTR